MSKHNALALAVGSIMFVVCGAVGVAQLVTPVVRPWFEGGSAPSSTPEVSWVSLSQRGVVERVVDGDTVVVLLPTGQRETVRVIGIDTPETVQPDYPVECFGVEASEYAATLLRPGETVTVTFDVSQGERDTYGRLLAYLTLPDMRDFGAVMVAEGYAYEYTYAAPYDKQIIYQAAEVAARAAGKGLWGTAGCVDA